MKKALILLAVCLISIPALAQPPAAGGGMPTNEIIMERNDANKDGVITKAEAEAAETQLGMNFAMFDLDDDGEVTAGELDTMRANMAQGGGQ